jgi:hypothetical protein
MENKRQSASSSSNVTKIITPERNPRAESRRTNHIRRDVETCDRNVAAFGTDEEKHAFIIQWMKEQSDATEFGTSRSSKKNKSTATIDGEDSKKSYKEYDSGDSTKSDDDSDDRTAPYYSSDDGSGNDDDGDGDGDNKNKGSDGAKVVNDKHVEGIGHTVSTSISISRPKKRSRSTDDDDDDDDEEEDEGTNDHHTILGVVSLQRKVEMYRFCKRKSTHF